MKMSRIESAMRLALAFYKAFNRHDSAGILQLLSNDCVVESNYPAPDGMVYSGIDEVAQYWQAFFRETPEAQVDLEEVFGFGKRCIARWKLSWITASGTHAHVRGADIFRVKDDAICEIFSYSKRQ